MSNGKLLHNASKLKQINKDLAQLIRPPRRVSVVECAQEHLYVSKTQKWDPTVSPYMIRPMNETASRRHDLVVFVGPARSGKTLGLILGRYIYSIIAHPTDFAIVHSAQDLARDLSNREIRRLLENSPGLREQRTNKWRDQNTYDQTFASGIMGVLAWPSATQLASRSLPVVLMTDYCRWPGDVGGEGAGLEQARKRTQTSGSLAMTVVESSPGEDVYSEDELERPRWVLGKPIDHSFPATTAEAGKRAMICPSFNDGTREWWYVPCSSCGEFYPQNPSIFRFSWGSHPDPVIAAQDAGTVCCWCGSVHGDETKPDENANGRWVAEGEVIDCYGKITGQSRKGYTHPSFALGGGAASHQTRVSIVTKYLQAKATAEATNDDKGLKFVVNADIGAPYQSILKGDTRSRAELMTRAENYLLGQVPQGVRFLIMAIDIQKDRFVAQCIGFGEDRNRWLVDRKDLREARSTKDVCDPAAHDEDWGQITDLLSTSYPILGTEREMAIAGLVIDSGGAAGVTDNAYRWWRKLPSHLKSRVRLVKGSGRIDAKLIEQSYPDTKRTSVKGPSVGDVPVLLISSDRMKDRLAADLSRDEPGFGYTHFPANLSEYFYQELTRERKNKKTGKWDSKKRNESWILFCYAEAGAIWGLPFSTRAKGIDKESFWDRPPIFAKPSVENELIFDTGRQQDYNSQKPTLGRKKYAKRDHEVADTFSW